MQETSTSALDFPSSPSGTNSLETGIVLAMNHYYSDPTESRPDQNPGREGGRTRRHLQHRGYDRVAALTPASLLHPPARRAQSRKEASDLQDGGHNHPTQAPRPWGGGSPNLIAPICSRDLRRREGKRTWATTTTPGACSLGESVPRGPWNLNPNQV